MFEIVKSLVILLIISVTISICAHYFMGIDYVGVFIITIIAQLSLSWYLKTYLNSKERQLSLKTQSKMLSQIEQEATIAPCAYCGTENLIPVLPDQDNDFECVACNETNSVYVNITIAQKTVPYDAMKYEVTNYNNELKSAESKILDKQDNE